MQQHHTDHIGQLCSMPGQNRRSAPLSRDESSHLHPSVLRPTGTARRDVVHERADADEVVTHRAVLLGTLDAVLLEERGHLLVLVPPVVLAVRHDTPTLG